MDAEKPLTRWPQQMAYRETSTARLVRAHRKRVLVTGGAGFIGSHLCDRLLADNCEVICLDNLLTGRTENIAHLLHKPTFRFIRQDVTEAFDVAAIDQIYNLACPASPVAYQRDPVHTLKTSVFGAAAVLDLAKRDDIPVLQASTSEIYGDPEVHPQVEGYWGNVNPIGVRSCYDEGKRCAEAMFFAFARQHGARVRVARIFNTYGPRMRPDDGRVVSNFIVQALRGEPITIHGSGCQTRSFCFVDDLVEGLVRLMNSPQRDLGPINLGNPTEHTILEIAELVGRTTGASARIAYKELPADDPRRRKPDISAATKALGWKPKVPLEEGIERTVDYFRSSLAEARSCPIEAAE